ncbi:Bowman-Birk type trypsin inhibitor [Zea mays]|uniref:Bowman-Birk type trypsin inhibitor n=1 Tax=Zea mays TaxID=4577 RepID=UPI0011408A4E|nr:Bowman-Birk type trypsin inhibitor [Zea mays]
MQKDRAPSLPQPPRRRSTPSGSLRLSDLQCAAFLPRSLRLSPHYGLSGSTRHLGTSNRHHHYHHAHVQSTGGRPHRCLDSVPAKKSHPWRAGSRRRRRRGAGEPGEGGGARVAML